MTLELILLDPILIRGLWGIKVRSICGHLKKKLGLQPSAGGFYDLLKISSPGQNELARRRRKFEFRAVLEKKLEKA